MNNSFESVEASLRPREVNAKFLSGMLRQGAPLEVADIEMLLETGSISADEAEKALDKRRDIKEQIEALDRHPLLFDEYFARCNRAGFTLAWSDRDILKEDWKCEYPAMFDNDFVALIDSHYTRFCDLVPHEKFWLYIEQSRRWMEVPLPDLDSLDDYSRKIHYKREFERISTNTLYALNQYGWYKESSVEGGEAKYVATMAMAFILYLFDDGRSMYLGKGRQITSTTTLSLAANIKMVTRKNVHVKLIACDKDTTEEIFEDKVKYAFGRFVKWMQPKVINDKDNLFRVSFTVSGKKGTRKALTSKVAIVAPKLSAINGGAPDVVLVDEAPFLDIFHGMVMEGKPTMFTTVNGKLIMRRQLIAWGTGGRSAKGGGSFEREHRGLFEKWKARDFSDGIVPIFLDWTCRPNITPEFYLNEKRAYMAGSIDGQNQSSIEDRDLLFRQHYPSSIDDMYSIGGATLVPISFIIKNQDKITALPHGMRPVMGHFEPIYNKSVRQPEGSFMMYEKRGVQFVPADEHDVNAPVTMFMPPRKGEWLYYQFTDPIQSDEGYSRHASAILDAELKTIPCIVNTRYDDPYKAYLQGKLMGEYYANVGQQYCPELVENNIGKTYIKWIQGHEWKGLRSLVTNTMLPDFLQGGGDIIGIDTKMGRKSIVVDLGKNYLMSHGGNIYIPQLWSQLRYFTGKTSTTGKTTWQVDNRKEHQDDVVDAVFGSFICRLCFGNRTPRTIQEGDTQGGKGKDIRTGNIMVFDRQARRNRLVPASEASRYYKGQSHGI